MISSVNPSFTFLPPPTLSLRLLALSFLCVGCVSSLLSVSTIRHFWSVLLISLHWAQHPTCVSCWHSLWVYYKYPITNYFNGFLCSFSCFCVAWQYSFCCLIVIINMYVNGPALFHCLTSHSICQYQITSSHFFLQWHKLAIYCIKHIELSGVLALCYKPITNTSVIFSYINKVIWYVQQSSFFR